MSARQGSGGSCRRAASNSDLLLRGGSYILIKTQYLLALPLALVTFATNPPRSVVCQYLFPRLLRRKMEKLNDRDPARPKKMVNHWGSRSDRFVLRLPQEDESLRRLAC
jgi:hypothetical protein